MELLLPFPLYLVFASITAEYHLTRKSCACIYACLVHALMHVLVPLKKKIGSRGLHVATSVGGK